MLNVLVATGVKLRLNMCVNVKDRIFKFGAFHSATVTSALSFNRFFRKNSPVNGKATLLEVFLLNHCFSFDLIQCIYSGNSVLQTSMLYNNFHKAVSRDCFVLLLFKYFSKEKFQNYNCEIN